MCSSKIKALLIICMLTLLIFSNIFAVEYTVPRAAYSVYSADLDLDGDNDIVIGHKFFPPTNWGGVSILKNNGNGVFNILDSLSITNGFSPITGAKIDNDGYIDILGQTLTNDAEPISNRNIGVIYNYGFQSFDHLAYQPLNTREPIYDITTGDIDGDSYTDIIVASNHGQFWGVLYNNGTGQFSLPEYHNLSDYYPSDIACGNLNEDDRNDIVISGQQVEVYFSYETGFECLILDDRCLWQIYIADMDSDGDNDIIALDDLSLIGITGIVIYENKGNNDFLTHEEFVFRPGSTTFEFTDFNKDNLPDLLCTNSSNDSLYILYNQGNFNLSQPKPVFVANYGEYERRSFCADLDGNGYPDIITIRYLYGPVRPNLNILFNDGQGNFVSEPVSIEDNEELVIRNEELTNYPNPFNPATTISFTIEQATPVQLRIYDLQGRLVKQLINQKLEGGKHEVSWNGQDENKRSCSSGIYLLSLELAGSRQLSKKIMLVK